MAAHLWTGAPPPLEYVILTLCRAWHCPPDVARRQSLPDAMATLAILGIEAKVAEAQVKSTWRERDGKLLAEDFS